MKFKKTDIEYSKQRIAASNTITIITHFNPDGDAIGSSTALFHYLNSLNKDVYVIIPNPVPHSLNFLLEGVNYIIAEKDFKSAKKRIKDTDLLIIADMNEYHRCGENLEMVLKEYKSDTLLLDHHQGPVCSDIAFSYPDESSTCEIVFNFLSKIENKKQFNTLISTSLYVGIMTDTGSLTYSANNPSVYLTIANLLKSGIKANKISQKIFDTYSVSRLNLLGYAISNKIKVFEKQKAAFIALNLKELQRFNYQPGDLEGVVNYCLKLEIVDFCVLITERDNKIRMSFRSKDESIDVNKFAMRFWNGGGHIMAAGGKSFKSLDYVVNKITEQIENEDFISVK